MEYALYGSSPAMHTHVFSVPRAQWKTEAIALLTFITCTRIYYVINSSNHHLNVLHLLMSLVYLFIYLLNLTTGNGGNAGRQTLHILKVRGYVELTSCRGFGGQAAINGSGGAGEDSEILN